MTNPILPTLGLGHDHLGRLNTQCATCPFISGCSRSASGCLRGDDLAEIAALRNALAGLFAGGFIEAGTRAHSEWAQELEARLEPCRILLGVGE